MIFVRISDVSSLTVRKSIIRYVRKPLLLIIRNPQHQEIAVASEPALGSEAAA
jgi:hypothetical protein